MSLTILMPESSFLMEMSSSMGRLGSKVAEGFQKWAVPVKTRDAEELEVISLQS
jgi:hypothetical protein